MGPRCLSYKVVHHALARPAVDAPYDATTLLSIFQIRDAGGQGPRQLTSWNRNLLRGLTMTNGALSAARQRASIAAQMERAPTSTDAE